ncbi:hypothetical protein [Sulfoacidibacillus thermotolerans]|uniref:Thioredoxin domain-containing protein n=1 Tax=Sulfoacidibacillus thermotolerans TaxID=1765684 RepID=A0A2U3D5P1_SULT2|nr:hypothetical protein [Sulfoacidibacillus thermotolerans]PWI56595.1 hypothetical protein BM613_12905 [Sulfoacidibacillus thermotolerans]
MKEKKKVQLAIFVSFGIVLGVGTYSLLLENEPMRENVWSKLSPANPTLVQAIESTPVENVYGQRVRLPLDRPLLFSAPFCPWCAKTERLLIQSRLIDKVQIVGVDVEGGEQGRVSSHTVHNATQAREVFREYWRYYGVHSTTLDLLFALPNNPINSVIQTYPTLLVPHDGHWYELIGYDSNTSFWDSILH